MSELRKANTDFPCFITLTLAGWIDLFTRERYCEVMIESIRFCMTNKGLRVFEYVIMPSHVHLIVQHLDGQLPGIIRDLKSFTAKEFLKIVKEQGESRQDWMLYMFRYFAKSTKQNKEFMVWKKTNHPVVLSSPTVYQQKARYIRMNPVTSGYVTDGTTWKYSSACMFSPLKMTDAGDWPEAGEQWSLGKLGLVESLGKPERLIDISYKSL